MKKKLIVLLALCFALNTVAFAEDIVIENLTEETVEEVTEVEEITEIEEIIEPEFTLIVETVTEAETEEFVTDTVVESEIVIEETVTDTELVTEPEDEAETMPIEESSEVVTEAASEIDETEIPSEEAPSDYVIEAVNEDVAIEERRIEIISAEVDSIIIEDNVEKEKQIRIHISGNNLEGRYASIKVSPLNGYSESIYIKSVEVLNPTYEIIEISIPEDISGIYRVDVNVENLKRATQVIVAGESSDSELKCEANRKNAVITGQSKTVGVKPVNIKVMSDGGSIVYLRQITTHEDGSYSVNVTLPAESMSYVIWAVVEGESNGYVKTMTAFTPERVKAEITYTLTGAEDEIKDVLVYGKNVLDKGKYVYEIDYSENIITPFEIFDLCAFTRDKETSKGYTENKKIEILSVSGGKIRFVAENDSEYDSEKMWSGIINIVRFKKITSQGAKITLRVYE